jgi:hypothetical protein
MQIYPNPIASVINTITVFESKESIVRIIESGWPDRFHAVFENGHNTSVKYELLFVNEIKERYGFDPKEVFDYYKKEMETK